MKTRILGTFFVIFAITVGIAATPAAFADHAKAEVSLPAGSGVKGCEVDNMCFIPHTVTIDVGGEVIWTNDDTAAHTVTAGDLNEDPQTVGVNYPNGFDSSIFMAGAEYKHTFDVAGDYPYYCMVHPWMEGMVKVQEAMAEDDHGDGMMASEVMATINVASAKANERAKIDVTITNADGSAVEHVNYNVKATQGSKVVLDETVHDHDGIMTHETAPLPLAASDTMPLNVSVTFQGFGLPGEEATWTGPIGETIATKQVVPEFGTIAMMILGVAIISIIALSAKTRVIPKL